jgi:molybdopterin converting factor small subunit
MRVNLRLYGELGASAGQRTMNVEVPDKTTLGELASKLRRQYLAKRPAVEGATDDLDGCRVLVNGQDAEYVGGSLKELEDGDTVTFIPPIAGG